MTVAVTGQSRPAVGVVRAMSVWTCMGVGLSGSVGHHATSGSPRVRVGCLSLWMHQWASEGLFLWCVGPLGTAVTRGSVASS